MEIYHPDKINEEAFWNWLIPRITPEQLSEMYCYALMLKDYYVSKYNISSILEEMARTSSDAIRKFITQDKHYQDKYNDYDRQFISSLLDYMDFYIKEKQTTSQKEQTPQSDTTKTLEKEKKRSVREEFFDFIRVKRYEFDDFLDPIMYAKSFGTVASALNLTFDDIFSEDISKCYLLRSILENQDDKFKTDEQRQRYHKALKYYDLFLESRSDSLGSQQNPDTEDSSKTIISTQSEIPSSQPPWTFDESIILLDACIRSLEQPEKRNQIVQETSKFLRDMAIKQNKVIGVKYRNENGIHFQLMSMESALAGKKIKKPATKLFTETVKLYKNSPQKYLAELSRIKISNSDNEILLSNKTKKLNYRHLIGIKKYDQISVPIYRLIQVNIEELENIKLSEFPEFEKTWRLLARNGIMDLYSLLDLTQEKIAHLKGFGKKNEEKVYQSLDLYLECPIRLSNNKKRKEIFPPNEIKVDNFFESKKLTRKDFLRQFPLRIEDDNSIIESPMDLIGEDLLRQYRMNEPYILRVVSSIISEINSPFNRINILSEIRKTLENLPENRKKTKVIGFLEIFPNRRACRNSARSNRCKVYDNE